MIYWKEQFKYDLRDDAGLTYFAANKTYFNLSKSKEPNIKVNKRKKIEELHWHEG